jgi:Na+/H+-dicarboxylate symporter
MKNDVLIKVFVAMALAVIAGFLTGPDTEFFGIPFLSFYNLIGQLFLNALTLVVVPLVASSIIIGSARLGREQGFGKLGLRTFYLFLLTTSIAVLIGVSIVALVSPGTNIDPSTIKHLIGPNTLNQIETGASGGIYAKIEQIVYRLVPSNIISVASQGQMLGLIFFTLLFGYFSSKIEPVLSETIFNFWNAIFQIMMKMTQLIMRALPIGVFGLMAKVVATTGLDAIKPVLIYFVCIIAGLSLFMFVVLPLLLKIIGGIDPIKHFKAVIPALLTAFSTSSSAATLPITIDSMEKRAGVPNRICSFVLPLGTTLNLAGSALFAAGAVVFIAQVYGMHLNAANYFVITLMGVFAGLGMVAGIPSASLITIVIILQAIGLPPDGIVLLLVVERILDMCRTTATVFTHTCCAALVYRLEKPLPVESV